MRILILNYEYPPLGGGAANALFHVVREFAELGEPNVDVVTSAADGVFATEKLSDNVTVHKLPVRKERIHYWTQREILEYSRKAIGYSGRLRKEKDYDLCHAWFALPCGYMARRWRRKMPYIVSLRGSDVPGFNQRLAKIDPLLKPLFRQVVRAAAAVQANSEGLRTLALKTEPKAEIEIIYNGVDCNQFIPGASPNRTGEIRLISVCRLIERKGVGDLIAALPAIKARLGGVKLTLIGEGNLEEDLKRQARELLVEQDIDWLGYVEHDRLPDLYQEADIFVLPSHYEGMSNSLLEAMAGGLAVVVTDTGGTRELFDDNGRIVSAGNPESIAEAVTALGTDRDLLAACKERSRRKAEDFSWEKVAGKYIRTYERAVC
jgi:glycosyltransferase involved in cell wall biosynthesis